MLRAMAVGACSYGDRSAAASFAQAAHEVQPQRDNTRLLDTLAGSGFGAGRRRSAWPYAAGAPVLLFVIVLGWGVHRLTKAGWGAPAQPVPAVSAESANAAAVPPTPPAARSREYDRQPAPAPTAEDLFVTRLRAAENAIPGRVKRGEEISSVIAPVLALGSDPEMQSVLERPAVRRTYEELTETLRVCLRHYRPGAPEEMIRRTADESSAAAEDVAVDAIIADLRGHSGTANDLAGEFNARATGVDDMALELQIRSAVAQASAKRFAACLDALTR